MKYQEVIIFTKKGNLLPFVGSKHVKIDEYVMKIYGAERKISLMLLVRYDDGHIYCKIKCPVNPLPVKGEFETPALGAIYEFLYNNGWTKERVVHCNMLD